MTDTTKTESVDYSNLTPEQLAIVQKLDNLIRETTEAAAADKPSVGTVARLTGSAFLVVGEAHDMGVVTDNDALDMLARLSVKTIQYSTGIDLLSND